MNFLLLKNLNQMQYTLKPYYRLKPGLSIFAQYEHDQYYGPYKSMQLKDENGTGDNIITFGVSFLI